MHGEGSAVISWEGKGHELNEVEREEKEVKHMKETITRESITR